MFHVANSVYLDYDINFNTSRNYIVASGRWQTQPIVLSHLQSIATAQTFEELLTENYSGSINVFWGYLMSTEEKLTVFLDPETLTKLQIQYWKSIFGATFTVNEAHTLHKSWVESIRLRSLYTGFESIPAALSETDIFTMVDEQIMMPSFADTQAVFNSVNIVKCLRVASKKFASFEYLLADYLANNASKYADELLDRVKRLTWINWLDELDHLRYEILSGTIDAGRIDPDIGGKSLEIGTIEERLKQSSILSWTVDPKFSSGEEYIKTTYDYRIFVPCWAQLAEVWGAEYDEMAELNEMINQDQYEQLLQRDIARNYGCSYTRTLMNEKCNQVFATYCYELVRTNQLDKLQPFALT